MSRNSSTPPPAPTPLCAAFEPLLALLVADELDAEQAASVRAHLADCAFCQRRLAESELAIAALRHALVVGDSATMDATEGASGALIRAPAAESIGDPEGAMFESMRLSFEDILLASELAPADLLADATDTSLDEPASVGPDDLRSHRRPPAASRSRQLLGSLAAIAAILLLAVLASALFGQFRGSQSGGTATPTPTIQRSFVPYSAPAPGKPCDTNPQAITLWSGDQGICLTNPPRTRLVSQGNLLAVMRWDAGTYSLPTNYKISVQVTLEGATTAKLEMDDDSRSIGHVIFCSPHHCDLDGRADEACTCDTSGPVTLAISVNGANESYYVGSTLLGSVTEASRLHPDSIGLGVTASNSSAQGAQAVFANFTVVAT